MTRRTFINASFLLVLILSLSACKFSYEEIIEEINSNFSIPVYEPSLLDTNYDYSTMISKELYYIEAGKDLYLIGPGGAEEYEWTIDGNIVSKERILFYKCEEEGLEKNVAHTLKLTVKIPGRLIPRDDIAILYYIGSL